VLADLFSSGRRKLVVSVYAPKLAAKLPETSCFAPNRCD
jgi:hypothetical protein